MIGCSDTAMPPADAAAAVKAKAKEASEIATASRVDEQTLAAAKADGLVASPNADPNLPDAREVYAKALAEAKQSDKRLLVYYGANWCMWCGLLERCLDAHRDVLETDYVLLKLDETGMKNTGELGEPWGKSHDEGIPWMVILDADARPLITSSDGPTGINIGHPVEQEEIDHFMTMLTKTAQHLKPEQLAALRTRWEKFTQEQGRELFPADDMGAEFEVEEVP
jgi:hypothetical protein